jgi:hypothetical protein
MIEKTDTRRVGNIKHGEERLTHLNQKHASRHSKIHLISNLQESLALLPRIRVGNRLDASIIRCPIRKLGQHVSQVRGNSNIDEKVDVGGVCKNSDKE